MIEKTRDYNKFKLRADNRPVLQAQLTKLKDSIRAKNMLEFRPILVNAKMEVIDGQHRLEAAKELGVDIWYQIEKELQGKDMIALNVSKSWTISDYINYHAVNGNIHYKKLQEFTKRHAIRINVAVDMMVGRDHAGRGKLMGGEFVFQEEYSDTQIEIALRTIDIINKYCTERDSLFVNSARFWRALIRLINDPVFREDKWILNLKKQSGKVCAKANFREYCSMLQEIYNWSNRQPVDLEID